MNNIERIKATLKVVPDFPKPGISFKDITPLLANAEMFKITIDELINLVKDVKFDVVVGLESRGFWFGVSIAQRLGLPFVPIRKKGKLPRPTVEASYQLEYGTDYIQVHKEDIPAGANVLIVDDIIATGGTILATQKLMQQLNAKVEHALVLAYLEELAFGPENIEKAGIKVHSLLKL
ncbi:MAG: adenine phosphoribosyltransferase [Mycoplasmoidaceae bacterium]